jgi:hypothetical protein
VAKDKYRSQARILCISDTDQPTAKFGDFDTIPVVGTPRTLTPCDLRKVGRTYRPTHSGATCLDMSV